MTKHQHIPFICPAQAPPAVIQNILATYDRIAAVAMRSVVGGVLTASDYHGLRRRVAAITNTSVEQVSDALAQRTMSLRPRHPVTRGIE